VPAIEMGKRLIRAFGVPENVLFHG